MFLKGMFGDNRSRYQQTNSLRALKGTRHSNAKHRKLFNGPVTCDILVMEIVLVIVTKISLVVILSSSTH